MNVPSRLGSLLRDKGTNQKTKNMLTTSFGHSIRRNQHCINPRSHLGSAASFVLNQLQKNIILEKSQVTDIELSEQTGYLSENGTQWPHHQNKRRRIGQAAKVTVRKWPKRHRLCQVGSFFLTRLATFRALQPIATALWGTLHICIMYGF